MVRTITGNRDIVTSRGFANVSMITLTATEGDPLKSNDSIDFDDLTFDPSSSDWTLFLNILPTKVGNDPNMYNITFYSQRDGSGTGRSWLVSYLANGNYGSNLGNASEDFGVNPRKDEINKVALSYELSTTTLRFFLNGELVYSNAAIIIESATGGHRVGATKNNEPSDLGVRCADGSFGPVYFYSRKLSQLEIRSLGNDIRQNISGLELEANMQTKNSVVDDSSSNKRDGALRANAAWSSSGLYSGTREVIGSRVLIT